MGKNNFRIGNTKCPARGFHSNVKHETEQYWSFLAEFADYIKELSLESSYRPLC